LATTLLGSVAVKITTMILASLSLFVGLGVWATLGLVGLAKILLIALAVGFLVDRLVPGRLPSGFFAAASSAMVGAWLGAGLLHRSPLDEGVKIVPAVLGALVLALVVQIPGKRLFARHGSPARHTLP
jgi:uncharacterized membrane protein YeaQ/YmgE (transglycosylase-associated protein family)